ncbi:hypothetical protein CR513_49612, partial [Mucuna pruriens]
MTRSSSEPLHAFDPQIERTLHHLRKARHIVTPDSSSSYSIWNSENSHFTTNVSNFSEHQEAGSMENNDRTLKELATPYVVYQSWCIQCPPLEPAQSYELKSNLIHLLPKFHGLAEALEGVPLGLFHDEAVGNTRRPHQNESVSILPRWSYKRLVLVLFNTWRDMKCMFLETFFPTSRTATIRKEICGIKQHFGDTLHEYWRGSTSFVPHVHITRSMSSY